MDLQTERIMSGEPSGTDKPLDKALRPLRFEDFPGQHIVKEKLRIFVTATKKRQEPLDHTLMCGPPGLGKTTLAHIIAHSLGVEIRATSGPALHRKGDLAAILTSLRPNSVFFIDEIHRLNRDVEEYLYSAMEDFHIDIISGEGLGARTMRFQLSPFTLIGATTRAGLLKAPFRDRFGITERLNFYDQTSLKEILFRSAQLLNLKISPEGTAEIARRSRGTPRIANRLLRRVRDYAEIEGNGVITGEIAHYGLNCLEVDQLGLDQMDRRILHLIHDKFQGGPVGIETLAAALCEETDTLEEVYEPFLIQEGLLLKTPRGRIITDTSRKHLEFLTTHSYPQGLRS